MIISDSVIAYPASLDKQSQSGATDLNKERVQLLAGTLLLKVGDDLLSHLRSTIGAVRLNFSVRNGKRWNPDAIVTLRSYEVWSPKSEVRSFSSSLLTSDFRLPTSVLSIKYDTLVMKVNKIVLPKVYG